MAVLCKQIIERPTSIANPNKKPPRGTVYKSWLAIIDELRKKSAETVVSLTEELKPVYEEMVAIYETAQEEPDIPTK